MVEINNKFTEKYIYFPRPLSKIEENEYELKLHSELTQKDFYFNELKNESKSNTYYKFLIDFSQIDDGEYNYYVINEGVNVSTGLLRIGDVVDEDVPPRYNYNPFHSEDCDCNEIVQYYPQGNFKYRFQDKVIEISELCGDFNIEVKPDYGYDALSSVIFSGYTCSGSSSGECEECYNAGYEDGFEDGKEDVKSKMSGITITENDIVIENEDGWNKIEVDIDTDKYYQSGRTDGIIEQKSKLVSSAFTENGIYTREDGWNEVEVNVLTHKPLTLEIVADGTLLFRTSNNTVTRTISYKKNNGVEGTLTSSRAGDSINVYSGETIELYGNYSTYCENYYTTLGGTCSFKASGHLTSLLVGKEYDKYPSTELIGSQNFLRFFYNSKITDASKLILPNNTTPYCYYNMFDSCTLLETAPELPATVLSESCYEGMFNTCIRIVETPLLVATDLEIKSYKQMFQYCSNLRLVRCLAEVGMGTNSEAWLNNTQVKVFFKSMNSGTWPMGESGIPYNALIIDYNF